MKTASTNRRRVLKNRTRAHARCSGVNTRRACIETTAKRTSKLTCTYDNRGRLESCSRDPIGYVGSPWNLYEYVDGMPLIATDPLGLDGPRGSRQECTRTRKCSSTGNFSEVRGPVYRGARLGFSHNGAWEFIGFDWGITLLGSNVGASYWRRDKYYRFEQLQDREVFLTFKCVDTFKCKCPDALWTHTTYEKRKQWEDTVRVGMTTAVGGSDSGTGRAFCNHEGCTAVAPDGNADPRIPNPQTPVDTPLIPGGGGR